MFKELTCSNVFSSPFSLFVCLFDCVFILLICFFGLFFRLGVPIDIDRHMHTSTVIRTVLNTRSAFRLLSDMKKLKKF